jgi:RNA polymerase sigma-70 factor (ECF subfamily)
VRPFLDKRGLWTSSPQALFVSHRQCLGRKGRKKVKIKYKNADGKIIELEVSDEVGAFYLESVEAEKKNDRRNSRPDRHTLLSTFTYEDARYFSDSTDILADLIESETINHAMSYLNERQQYLIQKCCIEGWSYTDLAALEEVDESTIRYSVNRAKKKLKKML